MKVFERLGNLPPINPVANQIVALSSSADVDLKKLVEAMHRDPALTANVLALANSALFGFSSRIEVLRQAIALLGLDRIKTMAMTLEMKRFVGVAGPALQRCWEHSVACAIIAEEIAPAFRVMSDSAYTFGLLHDAGRLGLLKVFPDLYAEILARAAESSEDVLRAERESMEVDHCQAGAWMVKKWALPEAFVDVCARHHDDVDAKEPGFLKVIQISCRLAESMGYSGACYAQTPEYDAVIASFQPQMPPHRLPPGGELKIHIQTLLETYR